VHNDDVIAYPPDVLDRVMREFIETTQYVGTVQPWRVTPETYDDPDDDVAVKWDPAQHPRDEQGRFAAYHGSNVSDIQEFKAAYGAIPGWFSGHQDLASGYADLKTRFLGGTATVYPVKLSIQNPIEIAGDMNAKTTYREERERTGLEFTVGKYGDEIVEGVEQKYTRYEIVTSPEFVAAAKAKGYDGIKVNEGGHPTWGVFDSQQVVHAGKATVLTEATRRKARDQARDDAKKWRAVTAKWDETLKKFDPNQPRDKSGKWTDGRTFTSEEGYDWHEKGPGIGWAKSLRYADIKQLSNYSGFGYHDVNDLRRGTYKQPVKNYFVRAATPEEMARVGWDVANNKWVPSIKVKEGEYKPGHPIDPRDQMTPEREAQFGHPMGKSNPSDFNPADPYHQVADGRIVVNQYYRPVEGGPPMMFSIQRAAPDAERLAQVQGEADALDDLIAHRGLVLPEDTTVLRGAYLPGVTVEDLQDMELYGKVYEEKGFTSTFLGDAEGRARSYPALGKWESIHQRYKSKGNPLIEHQDEVGTAIQFHITLPAGTKVASVEAARRMSHTFPPKPDGSGRDYAAEPTMGTEDLQNKKTRSESEILLGSGARFKVTRVEFGYTYETGDPLLKPVKVYEVHLEYIGGGSSEGTR
jgi:hypothetical protein